MNTIGAIKLGFSTYPKAFRFIREHKMSWLFLFPVILNVAFLAMGVSFSDVLSDYLQQQIIHALGLDRGTAWLTWLVSGAVNMVVWLVVLLLTWVIAGFVIQILMSPVLAYASEKTENILTGNEYTFKLNEFLDDIGRGILLALRNMFVEIGLVLLMLVLKFIPLVGTLISFVGAIMLFFVSAYFFGFGFMDLFNERQRLNVKQSVAFVKKYKGFAMVNGAVYGVFVKVPFIGSFLAGFTSIISTVAATIAMIEIYENHEVPAAMQHN